MARSRTLIDIRNKKLINRYLFYMGIMEKGRHKHTHEWILLKLSEEFHIAERTVLNLVARLIEE